MGPIRILFVDDEVRLCRAWARLMETQEDLLLVGTAHHAGGLEDLIRELEAQLVLMDISMPGVDPLHAVSDLAPRYPGVRFVMYSGHSDPEIIRMAMDAGAWGFVDKLADAATLFSVLRRVANGETAFPAFY